uniref:BPTI/Kunitz inhibitor domain-containing protein n=1 Tax=Aquila chrysaetos chrysaetos TaxID=223781 RepID=A0A663FH74_AQUCH
VSFALAGLFPTQPFPAGSAHAVPVLKFLPLDEGDCQHYTLRWYYNQRVTECRPFVYSGCRGNLNRFDSKEECELHCGQHPGAGRHRTGRSGSIPTRCRELGQCRAGGDDAGPPPRL